MIILQHPIHRLQHTALHLHMMAQITLEKTAKDADLVQHADSGARFGEGSIKPGISIEVPPTYLDA